LAVEYRDRGVSAQRSGRPSDRCNPQAPDTQAQRRELASSPTPFSTQKQQQAWSVFGVDSPSQNGRPFRRPLVESASPIAPPGSSPVGVKITAAAVTPSLAPGVYAVSRRPISEGPCRGAAWMTGAIPGSRRRDRRNAKSPQSKNAQRRNRSSWMRQTATP
jgi:hypothetical protein